MATSGTSEAKAKVSLDSTSFEKGAKAVKSAAEAMSRAVTTAMAATGVALLAAFGAKSFSGIVNSVEGILDLGESMANAGRKANLAAGNFYAFSNAVEKGLKFSTVADMLADNAEVLNRSATVFRDVSIKLWFVGEKIKGFWLGLVDRLAPVLSRLLDGALANSLVSAGQSFGEAIADAISTIYQLAIDGQLWGAIKDGFQLAFDYAGERMIWLGSIAKDIFQYSFSDSFNEGIVDGISKVWESIEQFTQHVGKSLAANFAEFFIQVKEIVYDLLGTVDKVLNSLHLISDKEANSALRYRSQDIADDRYGLKGMGEKESFQPPKGTDFLTAIKAIFESNKFSPSQDLSDEITTFTDSLKTALGDYKAGEKAQPTKTYENNTRREAFGADSLTAIGAGGGVYLGLSVLDVNKSQLRQLEEINAKLSGGGQPQINRYTTAAEAIQGISRAQTSSPVN